MFCFVFKKYKKLFKQHKDFRVLKGFLERYFCLKNKKILRKSFEIVPKMIRPFLRKLYYSIYYKIRNLRKNRS